MEIRQDYSTEELARALLHLAEPNAKRFDTRKLNDCEYILFSLKNICENEYNNDAYRTLWDVLQDIPKYIDDMPEEETSYTVYDLTDDEMEELKDREFEAFADEYDAHDEIPDAVIREHCKDIVFTKEDFFCNQ